MMGMSGRGPGPAGQTAAAAKIAKTASRNLFGSGSISPPGSSQQQHQEANNNDVKEKNSNQQQ